MYFVGEIFSSEFVVGASSSATQLSGRFSVSFFSFELQCPCSYLGVGSSRCRRFCRLLVEILSLELSELVRASDMGVGDFKMADLTGGVKNERFDDLEAGFGGRLYPGIGEDENTLRWGFIRKVYGILSVQILLTTIVAGSVVYFEGLKMFFQQTPGLVLFLAFVPLLIMCPLYVYHQSHPLNLILLGLFTVTMSLSVGISSSMAPAPIVLEALVLTTLIVVSLTGYTYWAAKRGMDFNFLGPILFTSLLVLIFFGFIQIFFPLGNISQTIYGGLSALIFSAYLVYDTDQLIKRYTYDQFILASVALYLDILNLFISILQILNSSRSE